MKRILPAATLAVLLLVCTTAAILTRDAGAPAPSQGRNAPAQADVIDDRLLRTARQLAAVADTAEEQAAARETLRLADHEMDQAFATQLRLVTTAPSAAVTGSLRQLTDRISQLKTRLSAERKRIAQLSQQSTADDAAAGQLALAKAQLALDEDELNDAQEDLVRQGGDRRAKLQQTQQQHESAQHETVQFSKLNETASGATLVQAMQSWNNLRAREQQVSAAREQAAHQAAMLDRRHDALEKLANGQSAAASAARGDDPEETTTVVAQLHQLSDQRKTLLELDRRIQDSQQLADVYQRWAGLVHMRERTTLHRILTLSSWLLALLCALTVIHLVLLRAFARQKDRRRMHQFRAVSRIGVQVAGLLLILLLLFGPPTQASTMIGLATAGLTVVLKDFIVAFFGWFVLMGRNGIRVGDWIEIKGVGGEVIEVGLLRTVLLEVGNWADTGHPTGRRVAFVNSFAIEGHYFNFSTAGQWLWDELQLGLPSGGDPYVAAQQILQTVEQETAADATLAEQEWERVTHRYGVRPFSAKPVVELRPAGSGLTLLIRYITRAPRRYDVKSRLLQMIVDLMHRPVSGRVPE